MAPTTTETEAPVEGQRGPYGRIFHDGKWRNAPKKETPAGRAVRVADDPAEGEVLESPDDVFQQLVQLAQAAGGVAKKKQERGAILDQVADLLNKLDPTAYAELLDHPAVAKLTEQVVETKMSRADLPPGADLGPAIGKKPWTPRDLDPEHMDWVLWTPRMSGPITFNGITRWFEEDVEVYSPKCFKDIHDESRRNLRNAREHIEYIMRKRQGVSDPTMLTDGSGRVRGRFTGGNFGSTGLDLVVPDGDRPGFEDIGEAGDDGGEAA